MKIIYFATANKHKIKEVRELLKIDNLELKIPNDFDIEETGSSFQKNADLKAMTLFLELNKKYDVLAEDSGLCIETLQNEPGIYSKRYDIHKLGKRLTNTEKNKFILELMKNEKNRNAFFISSISYISKDGVQNNFEGIIKGKIAFEFDGKAESAFGYDPIFLTDSGERFSKLSIEDKNRISHRGIAFLKFREFLLGKGL